MKRLFKLQTSNFKLHHQSSNLSGFHEISSGGQHVSTYDIPRGAIYDWSTGATCQNPIGSPRQKTLTLGLTWPPRGIHFWSLCHHFWSLSSLLVTTSDYFFMFPLSRPGTNAIDLAAARVARRGGVLVLGAPGGRVRLVDISTRRFETRLFFQN